jgi:uncharacterized membrane protein YhaH (DUF805 family)
MRWIYFFGSFTGRISRKAFWLATLALFVTEVLLAAIADMTASGLANESAGDVAGDIVLLIFLYPQFVISVKRGHDRNIATWVIGACFALVAVSDALKLLGLLEKRMNLTVFSAANLFSFAVITIVGIVSLALLIELGFRRGTLGPNRFGPDPLEKK